MTDRRREQRELIELREFLRRSPITRMRLQGRIYLKVINLLIGDPYGNWRLLFPRKRTGLLENSIIQNPLYFPDDLGLSCEKANAGRWVTYDFDGNKKLGAKYQLKTGKLFSFPLDRVLGNDADHYTPIEDFDFLDLEDALYFDSPSLSELSEIDFVSLTNYRDAFRKVGIYEDHAIQLDSLGITDSKVYQVTPKGNGLIFIGGEGGEKEPKESSLPIYGRPQIV